MASKKYLKGFSNFGYRPVTLNDDTGYAVDDDKYTPVPGGQSCSGTDNKTDYIIPADDGVWDSGADWEDTTLEIVVVETDLATLAEITGADITDGVMEEGTLDEAPELALSFSALRRDGGYRLFRYYSCRCTSYKVSHTTKGENNDAQAYTLTFKCSPRVSDSKLRAVKDVEKGTSLDWIKTFAVTNSTGGSSGGSGSEPEGE